MAGLGRAGLKLAVLLGAVAVLQALVLPNALTSWQHSLLAAHERHGAGENALADVGIVLGYVLERDGRPSEPLKRRVDAGLKLVKQGGVEFLIFSGAHPGEIARNITEAGSMAEYALTQVEDPAEARRWILEERSTSTWENALYSLAIVAEHRWSSAAVVTSPFHQWRSYHTFKCAAKRVLPPSQELQVWVAQVYDDGIRKKGTLLDEIMNQWDFWREVAAVAWYWWKGRLC